MPVWADQPNSQAERTLLQQQLAEVERQIAEYQQQLAVTKTQKNTLTNKIKQLKAQQSAIMLQIKATTIKISVLEGQIGDTIEAIDQASVKLDNMRGQIGQFVLRLEQQDDTPLWYRVATTATLADVFSNVQDYVQVVGALQQLMDQVAVTKVQLEGQRRVLSGQQDEAENLLTIKTLQQQKLVDTVREQNTLLQETKGRESAYQSTLNNAKAQAAAIRSRIYQLLDVSTQITFGQAYQIAAWVSGQTGVRPAFLLAILTQESSLGRNVGTCNRLGDPPEKKWTAIMKPDRDQQPFLQITRELGMDPDVTPVSCPMRDKNGNRVGWGGAMGPAQFIPSTWMGYRSKVTALTGKATANPWDIRDAFAAAAIKLKNDGATGGLQGEWNAAMRYFSGSTNPVYRFYGDNVAKLAEGYQADIDKLK
jgi:membrane-bound lytic murein transglycosylase B